MNVVIDLETLSLRPNAVILSIGAVREDGETFYMQLDWKKQLDTRHVDANTCMWWGQQDKDLCPLHGKFTLQEALDDLFEWLPALPEDYYLWARGPQFDIVVLENAFQQLGWQVPWIYKNVRDIRTALALSSNPVLFDPAKKHHALEDAIADMKNLAIRGLTTYALSK